MVTHQGETRTLVDLDVLLQRVAEGITVQDRAGSIVFANESALHVLGYASLDDLISTPPAQILSRWEMYGEDGAPFPPENLPGRQALLGQPVREVIIRFRNLATGDERWATVKATTIRDDAGNVAFAINFFQDITARKIAELALKSSEEQYRTLVEMAPDVIYSLAPDGTLTALSAAFEQLTGWTAEEWVGRPFAGLIHPDDLPESLALFQRAVGGEVTPPHLLRVRARSGEYLTGEFRTQPWMEDGRLVRLFGIARDVTERVRNEAALRFINEASSRLAGSLDFQTTLQNVTEIAVPALADCCVIHMLADDGVTLRQVAVGHADPDRVDEVRRLYSRYQIDLSDERSVAARVVRESVSAFHPILDASALEAIAREPDHLAMLQRMNPTSGIMVPLRSRDRVAGVLALMMVDGHPPFRPEQLTLAEELGRRASVAIENARLYQEARDAVRSRNELLSVVSHDLKNPLGAIKAMGQLVKRRVLRANLPETVKIIEALDNLDLTTQKMVSLIDGLLDLARLQIGQPIELQRTPVDLVALTRQAVAEYQRLNTHLDIRFECDLPELIGVWDPNRLERVLGNLIGNAIKYSPGDTEVIVQLRREVTDDGDRAVLSVTDQGLGIPEEDQSRIFDRYVRGSNVADNYPGAGIGLASVRQIVEQHGGTIAVVSQLGAGSTFTATLPL